MRNSVKLFSLLLALAIVFSAVPATEARAAESGFAPKNLSWEETTLKWDAPDTMPTAEDMGLGSAEAEFILYYEVRLYKTDSELDMFTAHCANCFLSKSAHIGKLTDGGTFYFTVRLLAENSEGRIIWHGDAATSEQKEFEKIEKTELVSPEIDSVSRRIVQHLNMETWRVENIEFVDATLSSEPNCSDFTYCVKVYGTNDDSELEDANWKSFIIYDYESNDVSFSTSGISTYAEYEHYAFTVYIRCNCGKHTDSPESEKILLDNITEKSDDRTLDATPVDVLFNPNGTVTWRLEGKIPTEFTQAMWSVLVYNMDTRELAGSDHGYIRENGEDLVTGNQYTSAAAGLGISEKGRYVALVTIDAYLDSPDGSGAASDTRSSSNLSNELTVSTDTQLICPAEFELGLRYIGPDDTYVEDYWAPTLHWTTVENVIPATYSVVWYQKTDDEWRDIWAGSDTDLTSSTLYARIYAGTEYAVQISAITTDLTQALSCPYSDYIELKDLKIRLDKAFFAVDTADAVYSGAEITKDIASRNVFGHTLVQDTDYTVAYANNTEIGTATITITGIGKYTGELTYSFAITEAPSGGGSAEGGDVPGGDIYDDLYTPSIPSDVTQSTTNADGSVTQTTTRADGTTTETTTTADGVVGTVERSSSGEITSAQVTISERADGGIVTAPVEVAPSADSESAPEISVKTPAGSGAKVEIPVTNAGPGTVAVKVNPDGTEEVIRDCVGGKNGVIFSTEGDITMKIVDRGSAFTDVTGASAWASDAVEFVAARELFNGTGSNHFTPAGNMSRGMMVTVLYRLAYEPESTGAAFGDVGDGQFYSEAVAWAADRNVANGYNASTFGPDDDVTREQMVTMLYRYAKSSGWDVTTAQSALSGFADANAVHDFAKDAMAWAVEAGIILGNGDGNLSPEGHATRAEAATIMMRFCKNVIFGTATAKNA